MEKFWSWVYYLICVKWQGSRPVAFIDNCCCLDHDRIGRDIMKVFYSVVVSDALV